MKNLTTFIISSLFLTTFGFATVTVDGYALLENQTDHSGIQVLFERTAPSSLTDTSTTDANGYFTAQLENGLYDVTYTKDEYFSESLTDQSFFSNTTLSSLTLLEHTTLINVPSLFATIQSAIDHAFIGDTVLVQPGTYVENINYNGKNIVVGSLYLTTQDTSYISSTIIDGNQNGSVVTFESGNEITSLLCGFTIRNGLSDWGGGVSCSGYSATLSNLIIEDNSGNNGGGIYCQAFSAPIITDVIIRNNTSWYGGGFYHHSGVSWPTSTPVLTNVSIVNNSVTYYGGGVLVVNTNPIFTNVTISGNTSDSDVSGFHGGGGIYVWGSSSSSLNSTFINTVVTNNSGNYGIYNRGSGAISILYSNLYNNEIGNCYNCGDYVGTNITVNANGDSCDAFYNIQENPYFVNPNSGDYHLSDYSPCIGAGTTTGAPATDIDGNPRPNPSDSNPDMGAYENPYGTPQYMPLVLNVPADYSSIQAGLTAAGTNDTVLVQPGTYTENIIWPETNGIKLISAGDSSNTIIDGGGGTNVIIVLNNSVTIDTSTIIKGFKIINWSSNGTGVNINQANPKLSNLNIVSNNNSYGNCIYLNESNDAIIQNCMLINADRGIYITPIEAINNTIIRNNEITGCNVGIYIDEDGVGSLVIKENKLWSNGVGIHTYKSNPLIYANIIFQNERAISTWAGTCGGGNLCSGVSPTIRKNVIAYNASAPQATDGTVIHISNTEAIIDSNLFFLNTAPRLIETGQFSPSINYNNFESNYSENIIIFVRSRFYSIPRIQI